MFFLVLTYGFFQCSFNFENYHFLHVSFVFVFSFLYIATWWPPFFFSVKFSSIYDQSDYSHLFLYYKEVFSQRRTNSKCKLAFEIANVIINIECCIIIDFNPLMTTLKPQSNGLI